jgi:flagellar motor switch protein FliG
MTEKYHPLRNVAIVVSALDHRSADMLLEQMLPEEAARVRQAVIDLDPVDDQEQQQIIAQFLRGESGPGTPGDAAVELAISATGAERVTDRRSPDGEPDQPSGACGWSGNLQDASGDELLELVRQEQPQTLSVIISELPPALASEVLVRLDAPLRMEILRRIATRGETDPQIVREIQQEIETRLSRQKELKAVQASGMATLRAILAATSREHRHHLLATVAHQDRRLAAHLALALGEEPAHAGHEVRSRLAPSSETAAPGDRWPPEYGNPSEDAMAAGKRMNSAAGNTGAPAGGAAPAQFPFADLAELDNRGLAEVFRHAEPEVAMIALAGAKDELVERILGQLPSRQARRLQRQMCDIGPIRLGDVEHAQRQLAQLANELCSRGTIHPPRQQTHLTIVA